MIRKWALVPAVAALLVGVAAVAAGLPFDFIHFGNFTRSGAILKLPVP